MGLQGAQAEYVRVPLADATLVPVPEGVSDEQARQATGLRLPRLLVCGVQGHSAPAAEARMLLVLQRRVEVTKRPAVGLCAWCGLHACAFWAFSVLMQSYQPGSCTP